MAFSAGTAYHLLSILLSPNRSRNIVSQSAEGLESGDGFAVAHDAYRRAVADGQDQSGRNWSSYRRGQGLLTVSIAILFDWFR